jgi:hypothetical protein
MTFTTFEFLMAGNSGDLNSMLPISSSLEDLDSLYQISMNRLGMMTHTCNLSYSEVEKGRL